MIQLKGKSQAVVISSIISLLVAILLTILVLVPQFSKLKELSDTANAKQEQLKLGREKVRSIKDGVSLIASSKQDIDLLGVAIPKTPEAESALMQVSSAASVAGVTISSVAISDASKAELKITFSLIGSYDKILDFVSKIESNLRPTQVVDFTINYVEGSELSSTFNLSFPYLEAEPTSSVTPSSPESVNQPTAENGGAQ